MYTEMLAEGMVPDRHQQQDYLHTLRAEAARLSHLVENVLSYARLERGRADGRVERIPLGRLVDPIVSRLADRARQASMELVVEKDDAVRTLSRSRRIPRPCSRSCSISSTTPASTRRTPRTGASISPWRRQAAQSSWAFATTGRASPATRPGASFARSPSRPTKRPTRPRASAWAWH